MARPSAGARRDAEKRGRRAETLAAIALQLKGYRILDRRVRTPLGEVDLIAQRGRVLAFIEVKQRATQHSAQTAVPDRNWQRIAAAAANWSARRPDLSTNDWRYDLITVSPRRWPVHYRDFWRP